MKDQKPGKYGRLISLVLLSCLFFAVMITACEKYSFEPPTVDPSIQLSFADDVLPIFEANSCANCHSGSNPPDLRPDKAYSSLKSGYVNTGAPEQSEIYVKLQEGHQSGVTAFDISVILEWIRQGALNN